MLSRRYFTACLGASLVAAASGPVLGQVPAPRLRLILDNDFAGDPDGLFQLAHHLRCESSEIRLIIGSHQHAGEVWASSPAQAASAAAKVNALLEVMGLSGRVPVLAGAERALTAAARPASTTAAEAIIREALRDDTELPLYYAAGAGLTDLATAWLLEPRIGPRIRLIWIGGPEYPGTPRPPGPREAEYNLTIDTGAVQVLFNRSDIDIWQVPRSSYRQMLVTLAELRTRLRAAGAVGEFLIAQLEQVARFVASLPPKQRMNLGETYVLGDSPLVTLTSLQSPFQADPSSSDYVLRPRPTVKADGEYGPPSGSRRIRVYTRIDSRLTFEDMYARLARG